MGTQRPQESTEFDVAVTEPHFRFAEDIHSYIREYIRLADQKAAFAFTIGAAVLGFVFKDAKPEHWLFPGKWTVGNVIAFASILLLALSCIMSIRVVIPRLAGVRSGFVFWEAIAERPSGERYATEVLKLSPLELTRAQLEHCCKLAIVCRAKYRSLVWASWTMVTGLVSAALYLMLFSA